METITCARFVTRSENATTDKDELVNRQNADDAVLARERASHTSVSNGQVLMKSRIIAIPQCAEYSPQDGLRQGEVKLRRYASSQNHPVSVLLPLLI